MNDFAPAFAENAAAICLAANDYYVPYVSVVLESIKDSSSAGHNYDIWVLTTDISARNQATLKKQVESDNIRLRFADVTSYASRFSSLFVRGHFRIETYYRLLMPKLFSGYDKMVYLDSDILVRHDVFDLYSQDVSGYLLAAVRDVDTAGLYNGAEDPAGYDKREYMDNVLRIRRPYDYFQAGVILFNLEEFRVTYDEEDVVLFAMSDDFQLLDQDVLNFIAQGKVKFLDYRWNVVTDWKFWRVENIIAHAPEAMRLAYMASREDPWIIHYAGPDKPWDFPRSDFGPEYWRTCITTPCFPTVLKRMLQRRFETNYPSLGTNGSF